MASTSITAAKGRGFLLQLGTGTSPESYTTITGMRTNKLKLNSGTVDITNKSSAGWQEMLPGAGVRSANIDASGIWDGNVQAAFKTVIDSALAGGTLLNCRMISDIGDYLVGWFSVENFERDGAYNEAETFTMSFKSHGVITHAGP